MTEELLSEEVLALVVPSVDGLDLVPDLLEPWQLHELIMYEFLEPNSCQLGFVDDIGHHAHVDTTRLLVLGVKVGKA